MGFTSYSVVLFILLTNCVNTEAWSWNNKNQKTEEIEEKVPHLPEVSPEQIRNGQNVTDVDLVIDAVLSFKPQGNSTREHDTIYKAALREKLCSLRLLKCGSWLEASAPTETLSIHHEEPLHRQYNPSKDYKSYQQYQPPYRNYQVTQNHIHHHFYYNQKGNIPHPISESISSKVEPQKTHSGRSDQLNGFEEYSLDTTTSTVTSGPLKRSTGPTIQPKKLEQNHDCVCVPYDQCPTTNDVVKRNEERQQLPLDPRRLKRDMHGPGMSGIRAVIDKYGKMNIVRVPYRESRNWRENGRPKRQPLQKETQTNLLGRPKSCGATEVCCEKRVISKESSSSSAGGQCGIRNPESISGRIKNPSQVEGDSDFGEYPWQVAILKRGPEESGFICGGTLISSLHILTAAHCVKQYKAEDLKVRLGEWEVNHDTEFFSYIESDIRTLAIHPNFYAGTLHNDLAILQMEKPVDLKKNPHISPACLPSTHEDFTGATCWTTGWGKDNFGENGKYQNILQEIDVPIVEHELCQRQLQNTRLGPRFELHPGFICAGGEGKDACKGDGGGPMVCEREGVWIAVGIVSWGIGCGQIGVPGVYVNVGHYVDWIEYNIR